MSHPHIRLGGHVSAAGSYTSVIERSKKIGGNAAQFFSASPRVWKKPELDEARIVQLKELQAASEDEDIRPLFIHALYLVNCASENTELVQKSVNSLIYELNFGQYFYCAGVVVHLGSHQGRGWEASKEAVAVLIKQIFAETDSRVPFLIENSACQSGKLCSDLQEIRWLIDTVGDERLGWCYDTCHGWAAGLSATQPSCDSPLQLMSDLNLWDYLKCIHINDSKDALGSGRDRHANILDGTIPKEEWETLLNDPRFQAVPWITEVPGLDGNGPDAENIQRIRSLVK